MPYEHKIFLSYAREDLALAERFERDISPVSVFRDKTGLRAGDEWEDQLREALANSQHMVVLWSTSSSSWVQHEITTFNILRGRENDRLIFPIYLDAMNDVLNRIQGYDELFVQKLYPDGMQSAMADEIWKQIVENIADRVSGAAFQIPVVTVALTKKIINASDPVITPPIDGVPLAKFLENHRVPSVEALGNFYGEQPHQWKPFGGAGKTVQQILDDALDDRTKGINVKLANKHGRAVRWKWFDLMNRDLDQINDDVSAISTRPLILLIDPLSLCNWMVARRYAQFMPWIRSPDTIVAIIPPFETSEAERYLQQWLRQQAAPLLDGYFDPPPDSEQYAQHIVRASNDTDVTRLLRSALYRNPQIAPPAEQSPKNPFTTFAGGRT